MRRHLGACDLCAAEHGRADGACRLCSTWRAVSRPRPRSPRPRSRRPCSTASPARRRGAMTVRRGDRRAPPYASPQRSRAALVRPIRQPSPAAAALAGSGRGRPDRVPGAGNEAAEGNTYKASLAGTPAIPGAPASAKLEGPLRRHTRDPQRARAYAGIPTACTSSGACATTASRSAPAPSKPIPPGAPTSSLTTAAVPGEYHKLSVERKAFAPATAAGERVMAGSIQYPRW